MGFVLEGVVAAYAGTRSGIATPALDGIDLQAGDGERLVLIGPSGAGKTTLLMVCGLQLRPASGRMTIDGIDPWTLSTRSRHALRRTLAIAPQVAPLPPRQRVVTSVLAGRLPQLGLARGIASLVYPQRADLAYDALATLGLADKLWLRVDRLSGGERQRVSLARLLVSDATTWIVDEPLSALDPALAEQSLRVLIDDAGRRGAILIASLHQIELALRCFPRVVGLAAGRVVFDRAAADVDVASQRRLYGMSMADEVDEHESSDAAVARLPLSRVAEF